MTIGARLGVTTKIVGARVGPWVGVRVGARMTAVGCAFEGGRVVIGAMLGVGVGL